MPTSLQVATLVCGVRLSQAMIICNLDSATIASTAELSAAIERLIQAFDAWVRRGKVDLEQGARAKDVLKRCWSTVIQIPQHAVVDNKGFGECYSLLTTLREMLTIAASNETEGQVIRDWFELGIEIACGLWDDPIHPLTKERRRKGKAHWSFDHSDRVAALFRTLKISPKSLMRLPREDELEKGLFADLSVEFNGWFNIECGISDLVALHPADSTRPKTRVVVTVEPPQATLDGTPYALSRDGAEFLNRLVAANGDWISGTDLRRTNHLSRPDRIYKSLPKPLSALVESATFNGYRIARAALAS